MPLPTPGFGFGLGTPSTGPDHVMDAATRIMLLQQLIVVSGFRKYGLFAVQRSDKAEGHASLDLAGSVCSGQGRARTKLYYGMCGRASTWLRGRFRGQSCSDEFRSSKLVSASPSQAISGDWA